MGGGAKISNTFFVCLILLIFWGYIVGAGSKPTQQENMRVPLPMGVHKANIVYSYFMPVCSIVKTITPRCRGRPDALLHEAEGRVQ